MTDNKTHVQFKWFGGPGRVFAKVKIRPQARKMNLSIWGGPSLPLSFARDVRHQSIPSEDWELEVTSVAQVEQAKPYIMESFRVASTPDVGEA
jgi:predicted transport protein